MDDYKVKGPDAEQWRPRHDGSRARKALAVKIILVVAALGMLGLVAFREHVGFIELASRAAHKWFTFWNWLGLGAGTYRLGCLG